MVKEGVRGPDVLWLLPMKHIHPAQGPRFAYPPEVHLGGLQVLMAEYHFGDNLKRYAVPTRVGRGVPSQIMRPDLHVHAVAESFDK